mmetsp:Transcript_165783/g.532364  ORF Transcript_165783/g.532364 Transcript_165783/m.532364 type:complete len:122 (+) Transcript_165783:178-543(+)
MALGARTAVDAVLPAKLRRLRGMSASMMAIDMFIGGGATAAVRLQVPAAADRGPSFVGAAMAEFVPERSIVRPRLSDCKLPALVPMAPPLLVNAGALEAPGTPCGHGHATLIGGMSPYMPP